MAAISLPAGYTPRPPTSDDAEQVAALIAACQVAEGDEAQMTVEELREDWEGIDLAEEALVITAPDGRIVASADLVNRRYVRISVYGYVHPEHRGLGLGSCLVRWGADWAEGRMYLAPPQMQVVVEHYIRSSNDAGRALMEAHAYPLVRTVYVMGIEMDAMPPSPQWPEEVEVRTFVAGQDEQAVYETGEEAFQDTWSRPPGTLDRWTARTRSPDFDPSLWFLVTDRATGKVVALCLSQVAPGRGWIATVGVRRGWRNRGLGLAMLRHAFRELYRRGVRSIELSVDADSPTGAPRLYTRAGMRVVKSYLIYRKELRSGEDLSSLPP